MRREITEGGTTWTGDKFVKPSLVSFIAGTSTVWGKKPQPKQTEISHLEMRKKKSMQCKELSSLQQESIWGLLYYFNYIQVTTFV